MKSGYKILSKKKKSGDQGADLIVEKDGIKTAIQAKRYSNSVGNKAVQEVIGSIKYYNCDREIVITTSRFTDSAKSLAEKNDIKLIDKSNIETYLNYKI